MSHYQTGDIAKLFGLTNMGVHYLEKRGLLRPRREENDYRSYSLPEISRLGVVKSYTRMGFSLQEAGSMIGETSDGIRLALNDKREQLQQQLLLIDRMERILSDEKVISDELTDELCDFGMRPAIYYWPVWEDVYPSETLTKEEKQEMRETDISWLAAMPYMQYCSKITRDGREFFSEKGHCILDEDRDKVILHRWTQPVLPCRCLHFRRFGTSVREAISSAERYLRSLNLEMDFPVYSPIILYDTGESPDKMIREYWIPIKKD